MFTDSIIEALKRKDEAVVVSAREGAIAELYSGLNFEQGDEVFHDFIYAATWLHPWRRSENMTKVLATIATQYSYNHLPVPQKMARITRLVEEWKEDAWFQRHVISDPNPQYFFDTSQSAARRCLYVVAESRL